MTPPQRHVTRCGTGRGDGTDGIHLPAMMGLAAIAHANGSSWYPRTLDRLAFIGEC